MRTKNYLFNKKYVVLLIGVSRYIDASLPNIPNVGYNIKEMKKIFTDPRFIGIDPKNLIISYNDNALAIKKRIVDACNKAKNSDYTLFIYYAGHGIINPDNLNVYLTGRDTCQKYLTETGIALAGLREAVKRSYAGAKVVVLDACHSGQIHKLTGFNVPSMAEFAGVHIVSSTSEDECALFNKRNPDMPTYFTDALVKRVRGGINNDKDYLTLGEVVDGIKAEFRNLGYPLPIQSRIGDTYKAPFAKNVAAPKDFVAMPEPKSFVGRALMRLSFMM